MIDTTKHVALYARTSTHDQNPGMQVEELRRVAGQRGWQVFGEYVDAGHSGAKDRRPELDRLMGDVHRGRVDTVMVWKFDRFARSVRHLVSALEDFRARNVDFVSVTDGIDTSTPVGRFTFHVVSAVAELEREMIRERTRAGLAAARRRGARIGRPQARVDLPRARNLLAGGQSLRQVARVLGIGASTLHRAIQNGHMDSVPITSPDDQPQVAGIKEAA
jgi:DNA invertase Pin-like site-specific DNA recombinase